MSSTHSLVSLAIMTINTSQHLTSYHSVIFFPVFLSYFQSPLLYLPNAQVHLLTKKATTAFILLDCWSIRLAYVMQGSFLMCEHLCVCICVYVQVCKCTCVCLVNWHLVISTECKGMLQKKYRNFLKCWPSFMSSILIWFFILLILNLTKI